LQPDPNPRVALGLGVPPQFVDRFVCLDVHGDDPP
jgi:hypothetical protein